MNSFAHCLREQARRYADTRWFAFVESRRGSAEETGRLTYTGLEQRARDIAARLAGADATDQPVLLLYPAGLEFLSAFFGCLFARAIAVPAPLPATDPRALERAEAIIRDTGIRLILTDRAHQDALRQWLRGTALHAMVSCLATDTSPPPAAPRTALPEVTPQTTAYLQYTSGSTGEPRGVAVSHANLLHNSQQIHTVIGSPKSGTGAGWLPHYHDMGLVGQLLQPLYAGGNMVFTSPITFVSRPAVWLQMISRYRAAFTFGPDFAYAWLVRTVRDEDLRTLDISCLEWALNGAETVRASTLRTAVERLGPIGFRPQAWAPAYGMAESTLLITGSHRGAGPRTRHVDATRLTHHRALSVPDGTGTELVSSGRPVGADLRIVDPRTTTPLPDGHVGEIWVAGHSVAQGYWGHEQATRDTFQAHFSDGTGPFLRTGDLGFLLEGELYVTGRLKELVIVNGRNLYPQDIEEAGRNAHPAAGAGAAFGVDTGREHIVLIQEVHENKLDGLTHRELAGLIKQAVRSTTGTPSSLVLVPRNTVHRTTSGKIQRTRMRETFLARFLRPLHTDIHPDISAYLDNVPVRQ
ncbi:fatty acyl-AMP ligase [Streptomyces syringium]|uniref:fatty acyl-AMP ligase n=1 Tax=Streptomyces syringium TaxID=76729 RepID=UPI0037CF9E8B